VVFPVVFHHRTHTAWLACANCHPVLFKMKAGADDIAMADLYMGNYCGKCYGEVAFPITTGCGHCHKGMRGGPKPATARAKPIKPVRGDIVMSRQGSGFATPPALFPHLPHRVLYRCYFCHDRIFPIKHKPERLAIYMAPMMHGKQCGVCHN
jgi:c(7)-type cytochrome triheme protein